MCNVVSLLSRSNLSTWLSLLFSVIWLLLDSDLYLASCNSFVSWSISMRYCWQLYLLAIYTKMKAVISSNNHICLRMVEVLRMSPPMIFIKVRFDVNGASLSVACSIMASFSVGSSSVAVSFVSASSSFVRSHPPVLSPFGRLSPFATAFFAASPSRLAMFFNVSTGSGSSFGCSTVNRRSGSPVFMSLSFISFLQF